MFNLKKTATGAHKIILEVYDGHSLSEEKTGRGCFQRLKIIRVDIGDKSHGR